MARKAWKERRNLFERSAKNQRVVTMVLENPSMMLRAETLGAWLNVQLDAAQRILTEMVSAGLLREVQRGVFVARALCLVIVGNCFIFGGGYRSSAG